MPLISIISQPPGFNAAGLRDKSMNHFQSGGAGKNGVARLIFANFELHLVLFRFAHVGRVGNHKIERARPQSLQQVGLMELDAASN